MISEDMQNNIVVAIAIVVVMFISMRLLYGYWPWQLHPKLKRQREKVVKQLKEGLEEGFDFQPVSNNFKPVPSDKGFDPTVSPPFPMSSSAGERPPMKLEVIRNGEDHFDRNFNTEGYVPEEEPKSEKESRDDIPDSQGTGVRRTSEGTS